MKCKGMTNNKYCLECPYPECIVDRNGNLPEDLSEKHIKKLIRSRIACRKYRETHKEQLKAYRQRPDVRERKRLTDRASKERHRKAYNENNKVYYREHREEILEKKRIYREKKRCAHTKTA